MEKKYANLTQNNKGFHLSKEKFLMLIGFCIVVTFFSFYPALKNNFTNWDDNIYVIYNNDLNKPVPEAVKHFFGQNYYVGNYVPLTMISYLIEYKLAGLKPQLYHAVNLLIHLLNVILVFLFTYHLSGKKVIAAAFVSIFFGIHPMHVESVAWIAERKDVLYSFFFLLGLLSYLRYSEKLKVKTYQILKNPNEAISKHGGFNFPVFVFVMFVLSLLSKPAAIVFPLVMLSIDFYNKRKFDRWLWLEKIPFFVFSGAFLIIAINAQSADRLLHDYYSIGHRLLFASHSLLHYLVKLFLPLKLSIFYPYPTETNNALFILFYLAPIALILLCYFIYRTLKNTRLIVFGFLFYVINLILVLQIVSIGDAIMAERYTYMSYLGIFFILGMTVESFIHNSKSQSVKLTVLSLVVLIAASFSYITHERCKIWFNDDTVVNDLLAKHPNDRLALNNKGYILYEQRKYLEAQELFEKALAAKPDYVMASINLTNTHLALNNLDAAIAVTDSALVHSPLDYNLLNNRGFFHFQKKEFEQAILFYKKSLKSKSRNINVLLNLAESFFAMGENEKALLAIEKALEIEPNNYILLNSQGYLNYLRGNYKQAIESLQASLKIKPDYEIAQTNLRNCYSAMNDTVKKE